MIARATNPARYPLPVRYLFACCLLIACWAIGAPAVSATAGSQHSCAAASCEAGAAAATATITSTGVGGVRLGRTYTSLRAAGLLGKIAPGCELGGPRTRSAPLRAPLRGSVDLTFGSPRRVAAITVTGGAKARGVGIGATLTRIRAAFPRAVVDHSGEDVFGVTFVRVPKGGGGRLEFAVDVKTRKVTLIGVPRIPLCE
jgi:hypothetical protein